MYYFTVTFITPKHVFSVTAGSGLQTHKVRFK